VTRKKILYVSGSIGLGHVFKDLAIAENLRKLNPEIEITWLAAHPADVALRRRGEVLHPDSAQFFNYSASAENAAVGSQLNLVDYVLRSIGGWVRNVQIFRRILARERYDLAIGDETYEVLIALIFRLLRIRIPFVMICDFIGLDSTTGKPLERIGIYILNWIWSRDYRVFRAKDRLALFVGEPEDVPDASLGRWLPNRREYAKAHYRFIGYVLSFDPELYSDKAKMRQELGYSEEPLIICSIGGTAIGKGLLELCGQAFPIIRDKVPNLQMVLVAGPRLPPESIKAPPGVKLRGFVPDLYQHYAASDLAIAQGGHSSTVELTALNRPFIFFPIEGHSEAEYIAELLARHKAGIRMSLSATTPQSLAENVLRNLGKEVSYGPIPVDGAVNAAQLILQLL
jgi:UDP-N-acetylglucosamine:LPS N-acetylglucosamine transferase